MIFVYGMDALITYLIDPKIDNLPMALKNLPTTTKDITWINVGGQLMTTKKVHKLLNQIKEATITDWDQVHDFYETESLVYADKKKQHALTILESHTHQKLESITALKLSKWLTEYVEIKSEITQRIKATRAKDYSNEFRKMVYVNQEEMNMVVGKLEDNGFIKNQETKLTNLIQEIAELKKRLKIK